MEQALPELLTRYDTFILDSSLTLISPSGGFYPGVETTLSRLIEQHKQVIVFINHPLPPEACLRKVSGCRGLSEVFVFLLPAVSA